MPVLLRALHPGGGKGRVCGARCYNSKKLSPEHCRCICGRANHGIGLTAARVNTLALHGDVKWREDHPRVRFDETQMQLALTLAKT